MHWTNQDDFDAADGSSAKEDTGTPPFDISGEADTCSTIIQRMLRDNKLDADWRDCGVCLTLGSVKKVLDIEYHPVKAFRDLDTEGGPVHFMVRRRADLITGDALDF